MAVQAGTEVKHSPLGGRGLFATKAFDGGDVILDLQRPLIAVLDGPRVEDTCSWCFSWTELPVLSGAGINQAVKVNWCTGCKQVKYCSKKCQSQAWKAGHKQECKKFAAAPEAIPNLVVAVMQALRGLSASESLYEDIRKLETHRDEFEKTGAKKWETMQFMSHTALKLLGEKDDQTNLEHAKMVICALMCNTSRLVTPTFDPLGLALDPRTAVINHSCSANAVVVFDGPKLSVRALERIRSGQEIFISYIDSSAPFGVRQAELKDQYFFSCACSKCKLGMKAPQDAFLERSADFEQKISVIDDMIPQIVNDPAWPRHVLGESNDMKRLSALQFYAYSYLDSPDSDGATKDPGNLRKAITICRNTGIWPVTRAPMPALYQQYAVACLGARRYNEALVAMIRLHVLVDPTLYPQRYHPVRIVHAWTLATLAKAVSSEPDTPFCKALQACGVDLPVLFLALLGEIHEQVSKSHGEDSVFAKTVNNTWQAIMGHGGELDQQYSERGIRRQQQHRALEDQIKELWPKVRAFAADDAMAAQIDEALAG
jgi:SET and MYND domain-containing protein